MKIFKAILSAGLILFPFMVFAQLPYSPCSPSGGKRADVLGVEAKYTAAGAPAPTFTIPAGTRSIAVYMSSENGITTGSDNPQGDEDFITTNAVIDLVGNTSSGFVNYARNTNIDGSGTNVYGWQKVPLGAYIPDASKVGDATPNLNNVNFTISGSTLTISQIATGIYTSYYVEYLSPYNNSLNPLAPQVKALLHGSTTTNTDLTVPIPAGANVVFISAKGTNTSAADLNSTSGTEEGYSNLRFAIDLDKGVTDGFVTLANGGSVDRRSTYVINDLSNSFTGSMTTSTAITGDISTKLTTAGAVGIYDPKIYISGGNLIIKRDASYARDFDDAYVIEFYTRVGLGMSAEFIASDIRSIASGESSTTGATRTFNIPSGTNFIYFNETANAVNTDRESNENSLAAYAYIDLTAGTSTGYFYQQVGLSGTTRRDDNFAFKDVPLDNTSTRTHANTVGYLGPNLYDISFSLSADKSQLTVTNKTGLANPSYQFLLSSDFYGSKPDIAFSTSSSIAFTKGASCNLVTATVTVCNPGSGDNSGGMPVSFYAGDPTTDPTARLLATSTFASNIPVGQCKNFSFNLDMSSFSNLNVGITMIINDNGTFVPGGVGHAVGTPFTLSSLANQNTGYTECYYDNNKITKAISGVNNCPVVNLDPDKSSGATGTYNYKNYFTAGSPTGVKIVDTDMTIIDPDGGNDAGAVITLTNVPDAGAESLTLIGTLPAGITMTGNGTSTIILTGSATPASYIAALKMIVYKNTNASPNTTNRIITTAINDGTETGPASTTTIFILTTPMFNVTGNGITIADGTTTTNTADGTNYGIILPGSSFVSHAFVIQNLGTGSVIMSAITKTGDAGFSVGTITGTTANSTTSPTLTLLFNPASHAVGTYTATISIQNNDPDAGRATYSFVLTAIVDNIPVVSNGAVSGSEDNVLAFTAANFTSLYTDADGTALNKIMITSVPLNGSFKLSGTVITVGQEIPAAQLANITFTPTSDWNGTTSFQWNASDGIAYAATPATMTINVAAVNDAPVIIVPTSIAVTEDIPATFADISFVDTDAGSGNITMTLTVPEGTINAVSGSGVTVSGTPSALVLNGTLTNINAFLAANKVTYASTQNPSATVILTVNVNDNGNTGSGGAQQATQTVTLGITAVNDAPTGTNHTETTYEDTPLSASVAGSDVDGDVITYTKTTDPAHGTVTVDASTGNYYYTPALNYHGPDSFTATLSDGHGGSTVVTVNITITPVNDAPTSLGDSKTTPEDTPVSGAVVGTDVDGDPITYAKATDPVNGTVSVNPDGTYTYSPALNYNGADSFTMTLSDGNGGVTTATVYITITPVNDAPTGTGDTKTTNEDTPVSGAVSGADVDGDALTYTKATDPAHGTVLVNTDGTYTYTPAANYNGGDSFMITISDGNGGSAVVTVNITITPVNDAPTSGGDSKITPEDTPVSGAISGADVDGDALTYAKATDPAHGTVTVNPDGTYTYSPAANYNGGDSFTITISDGNGGSTVVTVNITITPVNDAPTGTGDTKTTNEDTPVSGAISGADVDGDALTYTKATDPAHGTVLVNTDGTYTYTPAANYNGGDSFTITISDGNGGSTVVTVNITITPVNDAPTSPGDSRTTPEDTPVSGAVVGADVDGDALTYTKATDPVHGTVTVNPDGTYTYSPALNYNGADSFTMTLSDGNGGVATATVNITITPVNDAPTGTGDTKTTNEDTPVSGAVSGADVDGDALTYTKATDPAHGTVLVNTDGTYTYTPAANYNGGDSFTTTISDGNGGSTVVTVNITITPVNDKPTGVADAPVTNEDTPVNGAVTGNDVDGDALNYTKATDPANGTVVVNNDGTYTYTPALNFNGTDSFKITIDDGHGGDTTVTVKVTITPVNDNPTGTADHPTTGEDNPVTGTVTGSDVDGDHLTFTKGTDPAHGTVTVNPDGTYTYTPAPGYYGSDNFHIVISDGNGGSTTINVDVTITKGHPGVALIKTAVVTGDKVTYTFTIENTGDLYLNTIVLNDPKIGIVNKAIAVTLSPGASTTYSAEYILSDTDKATGTVSNSATVSAQTPGLEQVGDISGTTATNDDSTVTTLLTPPVAMNDSTITHVNAPVTIEILNNDDAGTSTFDDQSIEIVTAPAHGSLVINSDGTVTYTPETGYTGDDSFTYRVRNAATYLTNEATVKITVSSSTLNIPTLFTPNGDGKNDVFEIRDLNQYADNEIIIVNRWGNEVFSQKNYQNKWNGNGLNEGTYYYLLRVKKDSNSQWEVIKGFITLIRSFKK